MVSRGQAALRLQHHGRVVAIWTDWTGLDWTMFNPHSETKSDLITLNFGLGSRRWLAPLPAAALELCRSSLSPHAISRRSTTILHVIRQPPLPDGCSTVGSKRHHSKKHSAYACMTLGRRWGGNTGLIWGFRTSPQCWLQLDWPNQRLHLIVFFFLAMGG